MRLCPLVVALALVRCDSAEAPSATQPAARDEALPPGVAAKVGDELISVRSVESVARAQGIAPDRAREKLVEDALLAAHARATMSLTRVVEHAERTALARALLEDIERAAKQSGEPTDEEILRLTEQRWLELDRPPAARTTHAVVLVERQADHAAARALAKKIAAAVRGATEPKAFRERADEVAKGALKVRVEALPAVTADGRVIPSDKDPRAAAGSRLDPKFSAAANAIPEVGEQSAVIETPFGFHVILLEEKLPELRVPIDRRREILRDEAFAARAKRAVDELERRLAGASRVEVDRAADTLTSELRIQP